MFEKRLKEIWKKLKNDIELKLNDWFVLYLNDLGFIGVGFGIGAIWFLLARGFGGNESTFLGITNWTYFVVFITLFSYKNGLTIEKLYKKAWHKLFPNDIVIPYINKKIK